MICAMNAETTNFENSSRQVTNLKQVILRSEAAVVALQNLIRVAEQKIRTLEAQPQPHLPERPALPSMVNEPEMAGLKIF